MLPSQLNPQPGLQPPSSLQSALQMDPNQHMHLQQQPPQDHQQPAPQLPAPKKRKKADSGKDDGQMSSEPRRLRRSHEACARCRSKKIKASPAGRHRRQLPPQPLTTSQCDSKHPRCTACATANTPCHQEDRHRQTLTPRGHTEHIEYQLAQCDALLKRHIPGFELKDLDNILLREGIDINAGSPPNLDFQTPDPSRTPFRPENAHQQPPPPLPKGYPPMYPPPMMHHPGYPMMPPYASPYHPGQMQMQGPPPGYNPHIHPSFQQPPHGPPYPPLPPPPQLQPQPQPQQQPPPPPQPQPQIQRPVVPVNKGQDPNGNDMSNTEVWQPSTLSTIN